MGAREAIIRKMKKFFLIFAFIFSILVILAVPKSTFAATPFNTVFGPTCDSYECWIKEVWNWSLTAIISIGTVMLIAAGYLYMTSQGIPERIGLAHKITFGVFSAIGLLIFSYFLLSQVIGINVSLIPGLNLWQ